ncbi:MAG TPA: hypothetical protein VLA33_08925 [Gemmatimonadota bacterium]|nr:hypothetical protein [Gemmatimonadota bacterium]
MYLSKLTLALIVLSAGVGGAFAGGIVTGTGTLAAQDAEPRELTVERLNVVNEDGSYALVLGNASSLPGVIRDGEEQGSRDGIPGILFYDNHGDEVGGLIYPRRTLENGRTDAGVSFSMDQPPHDGQTINLLHWRNGDFVRSALRITDFPTDINNQEILQSSEYRDGLEAVREAEGEAAKEAAYREFLEMMGENRYRSERIYLGSEGAKTRSAKLEIRDSRSRPRIRLVVDENDDARIEILDENGEVTYTRE